MKCPQCSYPNATGATHCQMCYEVFNKSAADRYLHAQKKARRESNSPPPPVPPPDSLPDTPPPPVRTRIVAESEPLIDWKPVFEKIDVGIRRGRELLQKYPKELCLAVLIILLGVILMHYTSAVNRLELFGGRLEYRLAPNTPAAYLVTFHTELKSWSERDSRLDTPLEKWERDEIGNLELTASPYQKNMQQVLFRAREWIVNQAGKLPQNIPITHPSLQPSQTVLDRRGGVWGRDLRNSTRMGRAEVFLMPRWPSGWLRAGREWDEPLEWLTAYGDWKLLWKGTLHWKMEGYENRDGLPCIHLTYRTDVRPSLWDTPAWGKRVIHSPTYNGTGKGEAYFDTKGHRVVFNDFTQEGALTFTIDDIYHIPADVRVGRSPRRRWGRSAPAQPGTLVFQIKDRTTIHTAEGRL